MKYSFVMAGGGTGGHIFPALAVARELRERGHQVSFIGTPSGMEALLVPDAGFPIDWITIGGLNRVGAAQQLKTLGQLPLSVWRAGQILRQRRAAAVFSMGGYVAGPVMAAALLKRIPLVVMEPNAIPGVANRKIGRFVYRALLGFEEAAKWFPREKVEITGRPVSSEFFEIQPKTSGVFTVLVTGGSRGARTLNRAGRESWPFFREVQAPVRIIHQAGAAEYEALAKEFVETGLAGEVIPFIQDMADAFANADLVISRSGGTVAELAAAGKPSILVPLPFAADDHQLRNAEALVAGGGARLVHDKEFTGERLFREVEALRTNPSELASMATAVRCFARPGAAQRAADVLEEAASSRKVPESR